MNTGSAFHIGSTHSVCQDYAVARNGSSPYVILSDGCSSSPDTDIGARLLVKASDQLLHAQITCGLEELHKESARLALSWADMIGVAPQSVDATLLTAQVIGDDLIIACSGDGVIVFESKDGTLNVHAIRSPSGYPFYPSYAHQPERLAEVVHNQRSRKEVQHYRRDSPDECLQVVSTTNSDSLTEVFTFKVSKYEYAGVASDGIHSFFRTLQTTNGKQLEVICLTDVLPELWTFKNSHGAFVERRLKKFKKDCESKDWHHADDLALAVIRLGD